MANKVIKFNSSSNLTDNQKIGIDPVYLDISTKTYPRTIIEYDETAIYKNLIAENLIDDNNTYILAENSNDKLVVQYEVDRSKEIKQYNEINKNRAQLIQVYKDVQAVKNSLHNIFTWFPGERILNPEFGSNIRHLLYNGITEFNKEQIGVEIQMSVSKWEPRVKIEQIIDKGTVFTDEHNTVHLEVVYSIPGLTQDQKYVYDYQYNKSE